MIGTIMVFTAGVIVGAVGRNRIADAAKYLGDTMHDLIKPKPEPDDKPPKE